MYNLTTIIPNENATSLIPEVSFNPSGSNFAVSYHNNNEVRIFDSDSRALVRIYSNPDADLDGPHGLVITDNHIIISNSHGFIKPSQLNVFRIDDPSGKPVSTFKTPYDHLREAHSLAIRDSRLVATYCENVNKTGAVVSYRFDDESGFISEPIDMHDSCFKKYGDTKGVSFNADGSKILVSFNTRRHMSLPYKFRLKFIMANKILKKGGAKALINRIASKILTYPEKRLAHPPILANGIAIFEVNQQGEFSKEPIKVFLREKFCRLENINIVGDTCVIADTINNKVHLHNFTSDPQLENPFLTISDHLVVPHGVKLSPDKRILIITNFGLHVIYGIIQWKSWVSPRQDKILVYELK